MAEDLPGSLITVSLLLVCLLTSQRGVSGRGVGSLQHVISDVGSEHHEVSDRGSEHHMISDTASEHHVLKEVDSGQQVDQENVMAMATDYLTRFGYLQHSNSGGKTSALQSIDRAIARFQEFAGVEQTGKMNSETIEMMQMRRCGVKDIMTEEEELPSIGRNPLRRRKVRNKRYIVQGSRWKVENLTYRITRYPRIKGLSFTDVEKAVAKAFSVWGRETNLKFERLSRGKAHIEIRFESGRHGDDDPFDGKGGTLAHAYFPVFGGDVHFDADEDWTVNSYAGTSLLMTASHELGHSLGLSHSSVRKSLMAPFYRGFEREIKLDIDDIRGIQSLYGERLENNIIDDRKDDILPIVRRNNRPVISAPPPLPVQKRNKSDDPRSKNTDGDICRVGRVDTMVTTRDGLTYVFGGNKYWRLSDTAVASGYPRNISDDWSGLPGNLDASLRWTNGKTYFFKGSKYWRFSRGEKLDPGYPKTIAKGFPGIPNNIDASFTWQVNSKIYFFKGSKYWKFDPDREPPVESSYPRPVSNWKNIPNNLDAATQYSNGKSYFFKGDKYYRFDDVNLELDTSAIPPFPRETGFWWFGCDAKRTL